MILSENIVVSEITHITIVSFKHQERTVMNMRPWCGIAFSLGGELTYIHNSKEIKLSGNRLVFIPQDSSYEVLCTKAGSFAVINFLTAKKYNAFDFITTETNKIEIFKQDFYAMHRFFTNNPRKTAYNNMSLLYKMFSMLKNDIPNRKFSPPLKKALNYIDNNIAATAICNAKIAEYAGVSEVYLRKLFSKNLSVPITRYIQNIRIEKAKKLLSETSLSITEISEKCGYSSIYYFCSLFKKETGYTPSAYRNDNSYSLF